MFLCMGVDVMDAGTIFTIIYLIVAAVVFIPLVLYGLIYWIKLCYEIIKDLIEFGP